MVNMCNCIDYIKDARVNGITIKLDINFMKWDMTFGVKDERPYIHIGCFILWMYPIYD